MFSGSGHQRAGGATGSDSATPQASCTVFSEPAESVSGDKRPSTSSSSTSSRTMGTLSLDKAAFLLIRIRRAFRKKRNKNALVGKQSTVSRKQKPPLLRARTLPAIISPSLNIVQAQLDKDDGQDGQQEKPSKRVLSRICRTSSNSTKSSSQLKFALLVEEEDGEQVTEHQLPADCCLSPAVSPRHSVSSNSSAGSHIPALGLPSSSSSSSKKSAGLAKLARLLTQTKEKNVDKCPRDGPSSESTGEVFCFSWNKGPTGFSNQKAATTANCTTTGELVPLKKSGSVDSLLGTQMAKNSTSTVNISIMLTEPESEIKKQVNPLSLAHSLTLQPPVQGDSSCSLSPTGSNSVQRRKFVSSPSATSFHAPSSGLVNSGRNSVASVSGYRQGSVDFGNCDILSKADRKLQEKLNKYNFHLQALFSAVEHEQVDRARTLLETSDVDVNSINTDGFSALDIAVMTLCVPMVRLLQSRGARESSYFVTKESKSKHLTTLQREAQKSVDDVNRSILLASTNGNLSTSLLKEKEKQLAFWCRRLELLQNLIKGYESIDCPDSPTNVHFEVVGTVSLKVRFSAPKTANFPRLLVTKYKIEWSLDEKFDEMVGYRETDDINNLEAVIHGLATGSAYYCRVSAGNMKGFSPYCVSLAAVPSSWRDLNSHDRDEKSCSEKLSELDELFHNIIESRPRTAPEVKVYSCESEQVANQRKGQMRKSIKYLFGPTPKFQKVLKKGAYLGCLFYSQDKRILATNDDNLPIVEIDDSAPVASCFNGDFLWMLKISSTWEDIKTIRLELERSTSSSLAHFRCKLLLAVEQLQNALGVHDLGQLHYEPLRDSEGTTIICAVKRVTDPKSISSLSVRWLPLAKFRRKLSSANVSVASSENSDSSSANGHTAIRDLLYSSLEDMIEYNKSSRSQLPRGLYLGYLKLNSSVDVIRVLSFRALPNVLPYARIRENPHVSLEEWQWLTQMCASSSSPSPFSQADHREDSDQADHDSCTMSQLKFAKLFILAARALQRNLRIAALSAHRVFDAQIVELSGDVSFIILIPSLETVCTLPGQMDHYTLRDDLIYLPIQIFETIHMNTYQHAVLTKYSRISCVLEMDTTATHHAQREAFSSSELSNTKNRLSQLREFQSAVDLSWKSCRWLMDTINYARDKQNNGINFESLQSSLPLTAEDLNNLDYGTMDSCLSQMVIPSICLSTPQQLQVPGKAASSPRRTSRDDSSIGLSISSSLIAKNSSLSASSLQLFESVTVCRLQVASGSGEMRRCASTSGLSNCFLATSGSNINDDRDEEDPRKSYEDGFQVKSKSFDQLCLDKKSNQTPVKFQKAN